MLDIAQRSAYTEYSIAHASPARAVGLPHLHFFATLQKLLSPTVFF
jgi:hypothetical protein